MGKAIIGAGQEKINATFCGIGLGVSIILNFVLIPGLAHVGASISILATEGAITILVLGWAFRKKALNSQMFHNLLKPLSAALIMGVFIFFLRHHHLGILAFVGFGIYFGCLCLLKVFTEKEKELIRRVLFQRS